MAKGVRNIESLTIRAQVEVAGVRPLQLSAAGRDFGDLSKARAAYEKALELEPGNVLIKQNYELFKEINDRTTRQTGQ